VTDVIDGQSPEPAELSAADEQLLREVTERARSGGLKLSGEGGLLGRLTKMVVEGALEGELDDHLGYGKNDPEAGMAGIPATGTAARRCRCCCGQSRSRGGRAQAPDPVRQEALKNAQRPTGSPLSPVHPAMLARVVRVSGWSGLRPRITAGRRSWKKAQSPGRIPRCRSLPVSPARDRPVRPHPAATPLPWRSKKPDRLPAIRPLTCTYLVAGAGFEPATSGL
jgi:hypothetical protein